MLQECIKEEATEHFARYCAKTEQKGDLCSQAETSGSTWIQTQTGTQGNNKTRVFGVIGTRCLTADRCLLIYAIVSLEEPEILDIKVVTVLCLKKLLKLFLEKLSILIILSSL